MDSSAARVLRFGWLLIRPLLAPLAIPFLLVAWLLLTVVVAVWDTWRRSA